MGSGSGAGKKRAIEAAKMAISSPLLEDVSIEGATGILMIGWSTAFLVSMLGKLKLLTHDWLTPEVGASPPETAR